MLDVFILALELMNEESSALGLEINWNKSRIQASDYHRWRPTWCHHLRPYRCGRFLRLSRFIDWCRGGNDSDIRRRIEPARTCMKSLDRGIWRSSISLVTKLRLYNVYILPVLHDTWSVTEASRQRVDAFDQWCLRRILRVPYTVHVTNVSV